MKYLKEVVLIILMALLFSSIHRLFFFKFRGEAEYFIDAERCFSLLGKAVFIDAREPFEYEKKHILYSINMPYDHIEYFGGLINNLSKDTTIVVYSDSGSEEMAIDVLYFLKEAGFRKVYILKGGMGEWEKKGFPVD